MEEYINGCYTKYGTRPLNKLEIKYQCELPNGMYAVGGIVPNDGVSVDVYKDKELTDLLFMEHGIHTNADVNWPWITQSMAMMRLSEMGLI